MNYNKRNIILRTAAFPLTILLAVGCGKPEKGAKSTTEPDLGYHAAAYAGESLGVPPDPSLSGNDVVKPQVKDDAVKTGARKELREILKGIRLACQPIVKDLLDVLAKSKSSTNAPGVPTDISRVQEGTTVTDPSSAKPSGKAHHRRNLIRFLVRLAKAGKLPEPCSGKLRDLHAFREAHSKKTNL